MCFLKKIFFDSVYTCTHTVILNQKSRILHLLNPRKINFGTEVAYSRNCIAFDKCIPRIFLKRFMSVYFA